MRKPRTEDNVLQPSFLSYPECTIRGSRGFSAGVSETHGSFDPGEFHRVHKGEVAIYVARGVFAPSDCMRIERAFLNSRQLYRYDVRPVIEAIGKPLFRAEGNWRGQYFQNAGNYRRQIQDLFDLAETDNLVDTIQRSITGFFANLGISVRAIRHNNESGYLGITRRWGAHGVDDLGNATRLHEDRTQLKSHGGLETFHTSSQVLASTCIYYCNGTRGGDLSVYDLRPSIGDSELEEVDSPSGYGYAYDAIRSRKQLTIRPRVGDVITFFADHLHTVTGVSGGNRINSSFFSAFSDQNERPMLVWS